MASEQIMQIYRTRMQSLLNKIKKDEQIQLEKERDAQIAQQNKNAKLTMLLQGVNVSKDIGEGVQSRLIQAETYEGPRGTILPKLKFKKSPKITEPGKIIKEFFDPKSALEYRPEYMEKVVGESIDPTFKETSLFPEDTKIGGDKDIMTAKEYDKLVRERQAAFKLGEQRGYEGGYEEYLKEMELDTGVSYDPFMEPELDTGAGYDPSIEPIPTEESVEIYPEGKTPEVKIPDAKPGIGKYAGKAFAAGQTALQLKNIGDVITDESATDEEKSIAGVQGSKIMADLVGKKQAAKTGKKIFETAGGKVAGGLGGILGGYTMVKEAGEAGESWKEEDYDEAILHGMGSASGALQAAGGGMIASGVGSPLGLILYGVGAAGSVISGAGLLLEGFFGDKKEKEKSKYSAKKYLDSIRRIRS